MYLDLNPAKSRVLDHDYYNSMPIMPVKILPCILFSFYLVRFLRLPINNSIVRYNSIEFYLNVSIDDIRNLRKTLHKFMLNILAQKYMILLWLNL